MGVMLDDTFRLVPMLWCPRCQRYIHDIAAHDEQDDCRNAR